MPKSYSKADLHLHSAYSDGGHDIPTMLAHIAYHTDLRVVAITDHDTIAGALVARRLAPQYGLEVIVGEEISTSRGHLLALFIEERIPPGLSIPETVRRVHAQGGLAILAHPLDRLCNSPMRHWPRPTLADWINFGVDGLEALNGCTLDPLAQMRATVLGRALGLALTGGSDAHHKGAIGAAYTLFPGTTAADLRRALERHTCLAAGRRWRLGEYWGWVAKSMLPRTFGVHLRPVSPSAGEILP